MKNINRNKKDLSPEQREEILRVLKARFEKNMNRHKGLEWAKVQAKLETSTEKLWSLHEMERTGGEPDVVGHDKKTGEYIFNDCSAETPKGRERHQAHDETIIVMPPLKQKLTKPRPTLPLGLLIPTGTRFGLRAA